MCCFTLLFSVSFGLDQKLSEKILVNNLIRRKAGI